MTPERREKLLSVIKKRQNNLAVVLENVQDPHNISAVMRTCDAVGVQEVYVLNTRIPRHKKFGPRSSSSAAKWLSVRQFDNVEACFQQLRKNYSRILTTHLSEDSIELYDINFTESIALVFGNEHSGVSDEVRPFADGNFIIPQVGIIRSLNISVACAVSLYEAYRQKMNAGHYSKQETNGIEFGNLMKEWELNDESTGGL
jgi:tRNA (guanosine-2'-O-)-methyltransferase